MNNWLSNFSSKFSSNTLVVIQTAGLTQTIPANTFTKLTIYNNVKQDTENQWDNVNSRFVCKVPGNYAVNVSLIIPPLSALGQRQLNLHKNNVEFVKLDFFDNTSSSVGGYLLLKGTTLVNLQIGDILTFVFLSPVQINTHDDKQFNQLIVSLV